MSKPAADRPSRQLRIGRHVASKHLSIGILTYRRPDGLRDALASIDAAAIATVPPSWRIDEIIIVDNDREPSARPIVDEVRATGHPLPLVYHHEPDPGLAAARNRALDAAVGDALVFLDDDERAVAGWPGGLLTTMERTGAALVGGPVRTVFAQRPPPWVGKLFDRPEPGDDSPQEWLRSGNLAIDLGAIREAGLRFDPSFSSSGGEDVAFSWAVREAGLDLSWSASAVVEEHVGPERTTWRWIAARWRASAANWVRVEISHHPKLSRRLLIAARGIARLGQGAAVAVAGAATGDHHRAATGLVLASRGIGSFQGLTARTSAGYRRA